MNTRLIAKVSGAVVAVGVTVSLIAGITASGGREQALAADAPQTQGKARAPAAPVTVTQATRRTLSRNLKMPATLMADMAVDLFAKTSGYIATVRVDIGERVRKGDTLIQIAVPEMAAELRHAKNLLAAKQAAVKAFEAKVRQAELMVQAARAEQRRFVAEHHLEEITYQRQAQLHEGTAISQQQLDEAASRLEVAKAQVTIAEARIAGAEGELAAARADVEVATADVAVAEAGIARLETLMAYATVTAPFDGMITRRLVDPGAFVRSAVEGTTSPLLTVVKTNRIRMTLEVPESDASFVRVGTGVDVDVRALADGKRSAKVSRTAGVIKPDTRTMRTEVDLDNADGRLTPGMYAQVVVRLAVKENALVIPSKAVRVRGRKTYVFVARNRTVARVPVVLGYDDGIWAEILSGLDGTESVITSAGRVLTPGASVDAVPASSSGS